MVRTRRRFAALGVIAVMATSLVACERPPAPDAGASGGGGGGTATSSSAEVKGTINIGYFPVVSPVPIMQAQKTLEKQGYTVNWVQITQGLPGAASALAAGKLDMTWGNSASATIIFSQSPNAAMFVGQSFVNANVTVVSTKSGIKSVSELKNRKVVVSGLKTASTLFYQMGLKKAGVDPASDDYFVSGTGPGMVGVLDSGGAEVAAAYVPYAASMVLKGIGNVLFTGSDALGSDAPGDGFIASKAFASKHPNAVTDVLRAQFAATDAIKKSPTESYSQMATFAQVDVEAVKYSFEKNLVSIPATYVPDTVGLGKVAALSQDLGFAPAGVNLPDFVKTFVDTSFATKATSAS